MGKEFHLSGSDAIIATMHGKESVIAPVLAERLHLACHVPQGFNSDQFGSFSREVARPMSALETARAKIDLAFKLYPDISIGIASEGSFGPHPAIPLLALGREIIVLVDRKSGFQLVGQDNTLETNFSHLIADDEEAALIFSEKIGFPDHGVILSGVRNQSPAPDIFLLKDFFSNGDLVFHLRRLIASHGNVFIESDMRAYRNPTRMKSIARATLDLVRRWDQKCPRCRLPGFDISERIKGLPCGVCGEPTLAIKMEILACTACGHSQEQLSASQTADPGLCPSCNP